MIPDGREKKELITLLRQLTAAVEDLLLTGLGAASDKSRQNLAVSFKAASGMKLLRLGSTIRVAAEELGRYVKNDPLFSRRRYSFFLNRAWMLSQGMLRALEQNDLEHWQQLTTSVGGREFEAVEVVTLGVMKRVVPNSFVAFEFRLRTVSPRPDLAVGTPLVWSNIFPLAGKTNVPPEAYLHLPLPQKFKAADFLKGRVVTLGPVKISDDGRLSLTAESTLALGSEPFDDWQDYLHWDMQAAFTRLQNYRPGPFDLEVDLQEEIVLRDWRIDEPEEVPREAQLRYPFNTPQGTYYCTVASGPENLVLAETLKKMKSARSRPPVFGTLHYEMCRFVFQPLTLFKETGPEPLMLSKEKFDPRTLVKALNFT